MRLVSIFLTVLAILGIAMTSTPEVKSMKTFAEYQKQAEKFGSVIQLPQWETTPEQVRESLKKAMAEANATLDKLAGLKPEEVTFQNTVRALDDIYYTAGHAGRRINLIKETSPDAKMRETATEAIKEYQEWAVSLDYREDVYAAVKAYSDKKPELSGEDAKLFEETMRDYRRAGLHLSKEERDEVERLRKELARITTDFDTNVTNAKEALLFSASDLEGVPESFLNQPGVKTGEDQYTVMANITWHFTTVMENARKEETRKKLKEARYRLARKENEPLIRQILELRQTIAEKLGYKSWADYQIEPRMAKTAATASTFLADLNKGLQPKFEKELAEFKKLKAAETGEQNPEIHIWDWRYYSNQLKKQKYAVDTEQLRNYFPYQQTLQGMFHIYEQIFSIEIVEIQPPYKWVPELQMYMVSDRESGEPLGAFYLDMFPRDGKYNHFAQFTIIPGKLLPSGKYQRPVVSLICNFPTPQKDQPSILSHNNVETLFHEFGHALHSIFTRAKYSRFSGTSVPRDFVEAPSQMLENWVWDKKVLDTFAADYRNPDQKIPEKILQQMEAARLATVGTFYRRQIAMAIMDLDLHQTKIEKTTDPIAFSNQILSDVFLEVPENSAFLTYFGHFTGYDAGYYGYAWADAISADMATVFEKSEKGYFDANAGKRLREEIYAPGASRDLNVSIRKFLGRERSIEPFLKTLGIESRSESTSGDR